MDALLASPFGSFLPAALQGPAAFLVVVLGILALLGQWGTILVTLATLALGFVAHNLIVMNTETSQMLIGVPQAIYCLGGVVIGVSFLLRFVRFMLG